VVALLSGVFLVTATRADLADVDGVSGEVVHPEPVESAEQSRAVPSIRD
jgi:hypothetical protein